MSEKEEKLDEIKDFSSAFIKLTMTGFGSVNVEVNDFPVGLEVTAALGFIKTFYEREDTVNGKQKVLDQINEMVELMTAESAEIDSKGSDVAQ